MVKLIQSYLNRHYKLDFFEKKYYGVYDKTGEDFVYGTDLKKHLTSVFNIDENQLIDIVEDWAKANIKSKVSLSKYWVHIKVFLPNVQNIIASLVSNDIIAVQPMPAPNLNLFFIDSAYSSVTQNRIVGVSSRASENNLEI